VLAIGLAGAAIWGAPPAEARVFVGVGVGVPLYAPPPPVYYPPPAYYAPPPPPPAYYTPPPASGGPAPGYTAPPPAAPSASTQNCREYTSTTSIGGQNQPVHGTACLQPDGTWKIMN